MRRFILLASLLLAAASAAAQPIVGETHRVASYPPAALRDSAHQPQLRITVWYPAVSSAIEQPILIGPDAHPIFVVGTAAMDAAPAEDRPAGKRPVILLSHGFGGSARIMGWFGIAMARAGYVVIAVDHPGNNGLDPMTVAGALLGWERAGDLRRALDVVLADKIIGPYVDASRVGVAGFSLGGYTALVGAGARANPGRLFRFCAAQPRDGVCKPQQEFPISAEQRSQFAKEPATAALMRRALEDHAIPRVRAVFAMAPAVIQGLEPASLKRIGVPVAIILGAADVVAPPETNGRVAAAMIPQAKLTELPGIGHYNFLADCASGVDLPICAAGQHELDAHKAAIEQALRLFGAAFAGSKGSLE